MAGFFSRIIFVVVLLVVPATVSAQFGDGSDGVLDVTSFQVVTTPNAVVSGGVLAGSTTVPVTGLDGLVAGDEILLVSLSGVGAGQYEFNRVVNTTSSPDTLELESPTVNAIDSGARAEAIKVWNFSSINVSSGAQFYCNSRVTAFRCNGSVAIDGTVGLLGLGFPGGQSGAGMHGRQGTSYDGIPGESTMASFGGGGGGNGTIGSGPGGGGGSFSTMGTAGQDANINSGGEAGGTYGVADLSLLFQGSGGGGGGVGGAFGGPTLGGNGGGIIFVAAPTITIGATGVVLADGQGGVNGNPSTMSAVGGGGGGSGGSIYIQVSQDSAGLVNNGLITALGGPGGIIQGAGAVTVGEGGDGGEGRIRIDGPLSGSGTVSPAPFTSTGPTAADLWELFE